MDKRIIKDVDGKELQIGDRVAYSMYGKGNLHLGNILRFGKKMVIISFGKEGVRKYPDEVALVGKHSEK